MARPGRAATSHSSSSPRPLALPAPPHLEESQHDCYEQKEGCVAVASKHIHHFIAAARLLRRRSLPSAGAPSPASAVARRRRRRCLHAQTRWAGEESSEAQTVSSEDRHAVSSYAREKQSKGASS